MEIKVLEVKLDEAVSAAGSRTMGYHGRFVAGCVTGWAVLVPRAGDISRLKPGAKLTVETDFDSVDEWELSKESGPSTLTPLATRGDYRVSGPLVVIGDNTAVIVEAAGFAFDITSDELPKPRPADGSRVSFVLHGLSLWDDGH